MLILSSHPSAPLLFAFTSHQLRETMTGHGDPVLRVSFNLKNYLCVQCLAEALNVWPGTSPGPVTRFCI